MVPIEALLFDVDETLVYYDVPNLHEELKKIVLNVIKYFDLNFGYETYKMMVNLRIPRTFVQEFGIDPVEFWKKIDNEILQFRRRLAKQGLIKSYSDTDVLKSISVPIAAISNASTKATEFVLEITGLKKYFKIIQGKDYKNLNGCKPSPYLVLKVSHMLGVNVTNTIMAGDSILDILAAKRAGSKAVHVKRYGDPISDADVVVNNLYELREIFNLG